MIQKKLAPTSRRKRAKWRVCKLCKRLCVYKIGKSGLKLSICCVWFTSGGLQIWCSGRDALKVNWLTPELWHAIFPVDLLKWATVQISDTGNSQESWIVIYFLYWKLHRGLQRNAMLVTISGGTGSRQKAPEQAATIKMMKSIAPSPPPQSSSGLAASCQLPSLSMSHICHHPLFLVHHGCLY